jgi:uncharacterized protein
MDFIAAINPAFVTSGFGVGLLVGLTGVGGGSLMTPLLVLVFGINVTAAVGTDLLYASATKTAGVAAHGWLGTVDWLITRRLALGSLPAAALTIAVLYFSGATSHGGSPALKAILGATLVLAAISLLFRRRLVALAEAGSLKWLSQRPALPTIVTGIVVGALVASTSVGAGALGMTVLILLYPQVPVVRLVGADIAHAVPLTLLAGAGYWLLGTIDWTLLGTLLLGSIPGIVIGSRLAARVPDPVLRPILAAVLVVVGVRLL